MPDRIVCVAKETRGSKDRCGIELKRVYLGVPHAPEYGHVEHVRWTHWPQPREVPA